MQTTWRPSVPGMRSVLSWREVSVTGTLFRSSDSGRRLSGGRVLGFEGRTRSFRSEVEDVGRPTLSQDCPWDLRVGFRRVRLPVPGMYIVPYDPLGFSDVFGSRYVLPSCPGLFTKRMGV